MEWMLEAHLYIGPQAGKLANDNSTAIPNQVSRIHIYAYGTSYNTGQAAWYWLESLVEILCQVENTSEYRYQKMIVSNGTIPETAFQPDQTDDIPGCPSSNETHELYQLGRSNLLSVGLVTELKCSLSINAGSVPFTKVVASQLLPLLLLILEPTQQKQFPSTELGKVFVGSSNPLCQPSCPVGDFA